MVLSTKPVSMISFPSSILSSKEINPHDQSNELERLQSSEATTLSSIHFTSTKRKIVTYKNTKQFLWRSLQNSPSSFTSLPVVTKQQEITPTSKTPNNNIAVEKSEIVEPWIQNLRQCQGLFGKEDARTADCLSQLGFVCMRARSFPEALAVFKNEVRVRRAVYGDNHLSVGRALDCVGRAAAASDDTDWALVALYEALRIRHAALGPWNSDVADTLNNIAGLLYGKGETDLARRAYTEVISVRRAVFGSDHPCVAVTATSLGRTCLRQSRLQESIQNFNEALRIYRVCLNLSDTSKPVAQVLKNISRAERLKVSFEILY